MRKPNIIIIMSDDQGYGDLSCMGATDFATPNLDRLAQRGARFTDWYSNSPVCSPSRAALLTGRYPANAGVREILKGGRDAPGITPKVPTLATALKGLGYSTGLVGKWHLGLNDQARPNNNGFDYFYGFMAGCIDYYSHISYYALSGGKIPAHDLWENGEEIFQNGEYFTDIVTNKAVNYIREHSAEPFFLNVAYNAPHYPMHAPEEYMNRFAHLPWDRRIMAAMISAMDDGVGDIVNELEWGGIFEDTFIFFMADNGPSREARNWMDGCPDPYYGGTSGGLKGHKFSLFDGGIREPAIMCYPRQIPAGKIVSEPLAAMDIFPTVLGLAGGDAAQYRLDGLDALPTVVSDKPSPHDAIFWEYGKQTAVRMGKYKLVLNGRLTLSPGEPEPDDVFLSNLEDDISESINLRDMLPEVCRQMTDAAVAWREGVENDWKRDFAAHYAE